jgi:hypothetical protein
VRQPSPRLPTGSSMPSGNKDAATSGGSAGASQCALH